MLACDASAGMTREARRNLAPWLRAGRARVLRAAFAGVPRRGGAWRGATDGVFAFWAGAFAPGLASLARACAALLKPGGRAVLTVPGRWCAWEIGLGLLRGRPREAFRRLARVGAAATIGGRTVRVHAPPLGTALAPFARRFRVERIEALGLLLPPPLLWRRSWRGAAPLWRFLDGAERAVGGLPPLPRLADHALVSLRRC